jgi:GntR family transcriptional regulator, rspAB operon transcriptional repressor
MRPLVQPSRRRLQLRLPGALAIPRMIELTGEEESQPVDDMVRNEQDESRSLTDQAYEAIKWHILSMEITPGSYLNEMDLCERYGFSRAPIHHALQRLKHDQLVDIRPRKGVIVRSFSPQDINDLIEARGPLELLSVRLASERVNKVSGSRLKRRLADGHGLIARRDIEGLIRLDHDFHVGLAEITGNRFLRDLIERLHQRSSILWFRHISNEITYRSVQKQHEDILKAIMEQNANKAAAAMSQHLGSFRIDKD